MTQEGELAFVKELGDRRCKTFITSYHVSEVIGSGGEGKLSELWVILQLLYLLFINKNPSPGFHVTSYLMSPPDFQLLLTGNFHVRPLLKRSQRRPWWEDIWDPQVTDKHDYWPGWASLCRRIERVVEGRPYLVEQREAIVAQDPGLFRRLALAARAS